MRGIGVGGWLPRAAVAALLCPGLFSPCPSGAADRASCVGYDCTHNKFPGQTGCSEPRDCVWVTSWTSLARGRRDGTFHGRQRVRPKTWAVIFAVAFVVSLATFPPISQWGGLAEFTFAIASQDMPSGFYYDRGFDWPTGEVSVLIDVPVWPLHLLLLCCTAVSVVAHYRRLRSLTNPSLSARLQATRRFL
jgi:hypothetical protein